MMTNHEEIKAVFRQVFHRDKHEDQDGGVDDEDGDHDGENSEGCLINILCELEFLKKSISSYLYF